MTVDSADQAPALTGTSPTGPGPAGGSALTGLARGGLLGLVGAAVSAVSGVLLTVVVTRVLSKHDAGVFFTLTSVFLIAEVIARLGTDTGLVWSISRARALGRPERVPALLRVALSPVVAASVALAAVLLLLAHPLAEALTGSAGGGAATAIRLLALLLPLTTVSDALVSATRGHGTVLPTVLVDRTARPLAQLAAVGLATATASVSTLAFAWAAPWVGTALVAAWWLVRLQRPHGGAPSRPDPGIWREFWAFTSPRALTSVVQLALQRLDIVVLTVLAGPVQAALYTAATRFLVVGQFVNQALASVTEPRLARLLSQDRQAAAAAVYQAATGWLVLLCWPLYLLVLAYADEMLGLFGSGYGSGRDVVLVLTGAMLLATAIGMVDVVLVMGGRPRWNLGNAMAALVVNVGVDLLLIPQLGLLGAALGWAAAILVNNLAPLVQIWRAMGLHPFGAGSGTAVLLALSCYGVIPLATRLAWGDSVAGLVTGTALGTVLYAAGCWRWRSVLALDTLRDLRRARRSTTVFPGAQS
jgi:O-antigen/teichoic acid export membrane protein